MHNTKEKKKAYQARYYKENKDKSAASSRKWRNEK